MAQLYRTQVLLERKQHERLLALASRENAPLWTADRRLANAAHDARLEWVHWIGDWRP